MFGSSNKFISVQNTVKHGAEAFIGDYKHLNKFSVTYYTEKPELNIDEQDRKIVTIDVTNHDFQFPKNCSFDWAIGQEIIRPLNRYHHHVVDALAVGTNKD